MIQHQITTRAEYDLCVRHGIEPLLDARFPMDIALRVEVQRELFGSGHSAQENERFYRWCWEHLPHICEETMRPLRHYSAVHVSHILTRGANPEMAHDPRNVNILTLEAHNQWENGERRAMRIYRSNCARMQMLRNEYQRLSKHTEQ